MDIDFPRVNKLPPYIFDEIQKLKMEAKVAVSPGIGFGEGGDHFVRFSLVENEHRIRQATRGIRELFQTSLRFHFSASLVTKIKYFIYIFFGILGYL